MRYQIVILILLFSALVSADDDITLFDSYGNATAYIAADDELTVYMWTGKPVAYLASDTSGGFYIYGFNGRHLGWLVDGIVRDHQGDSVCAQRESMGSTDSGSFADLNNPEAEAFKDMKGIKPMKDIQEYAPFRPSFSFIWSETSCKLFFYQGVND